MITIIRAGTVIHRPNILAEELESLSLETALGQTEANLTNRSLIIDQISVGLIENALGLGLQHVFPVSPVGGNVKLAVRASANSAVPIVPTVYEGTAIA